MARVLYGIDELQIVRIESVDISTVTDPADCDTLYHKIKLDVHFVWQPFATASNAAVAGVPPFDRIGGSLFHLGQRLSYPRQLFKLSVGPDLVWQSPPFDANGALLPCDIGAGPIPKLLSLMEIAGDYSAMGRWQVEFYKRANNDVLLSNRWTVATSTSETGGVTRTIVGWAIMGLTFVNNPLVNIVNVDDFRPFFFCPVPVGFFRAPADVVVSERGDRASYRVVDTQDPNPMGATGGGIGASSFTGEATAGGSSPTKTYKAGLNAIGDMFGKLFNKDPVGAAGVLLHSTLPDQMASVWAKVTGSKLVSKANMLALAVQICLDRMAVGNTVPTVVGCFATQSFGRAEVDGRWVKVEMMFRPTLANFAGQGFDYTKIVGQANYSNDLAPRKTDGTPAGATFHGDMPPIDGTAQLAYQNVQMGRSIPVGPVDLARGNRGLWVGALIAQALQSPFGSEGASRTPPAPPPESQAQVVNKII